MIELFFLAFLRSKRAFAKLLREIRWQNGVYCPHCGAGNIIQYGHYRDVYQEWECKHCGKHFNDKTGTPLHYSRVPPRAWLLSAFLLIYIHAPIRRIAKTLETTYTTAHRIAKQIMHQCHSYMQWKLHTLREKLVGIIEIDETYITAGLKGRNNHWRILRLKRQPRERGKKGSRGRGTYKKDRPPILCLLTRGGDALLFSTKRVREKDIKPLVEEYVEEGSTVITDEYQVYSFLGNMKEYKWKSVNHGKGVYAKQAGGNSVHINTGEGVFSYFDPFLEMHRGVAKYNLPLYLSLFMVHRKLKEIPASTALKQIIWIILCHPGRVRGPPCKGK